MRACEQSHDFVGHFTNVSQISEMFISFLHSLEHYRFSAYIISFADKLHLLNLSLTNSDTHVHKLLTCPVQS